MICVIDGAVRLNKEDKELLVSLSEKKDDGAIQKSIVLINKSDLETIIKDEDIAALTDAPVITFSAHDGRGLDELSDTIKDMFFRGSIGNTDQVIITSLRHKQALTEAGNSLNMVICSIEEGQPEDFFSIDLTAAYEALGAITGEQIGDEIIDEIFSRFCMGK